MSWRKRKGFTLVELLLAVVMITALASIAMPISQSFQTSNDIRISAETIAQTFRRASLLSAASDGDSVWGVYMATGTAVIFKGGSYVSRDSAFDEIFEIPPTFSFSGLTEITFSKLTGFPLAVGATLITSASGATSTININEKGMVTY